jgi:hypothetical protein
MSTDEKTVIFTFDNERFQASPVLNKISGMLKDLLPVAATENNEVEVPIKHDVTKEDLELLNKFVEVCKEKFGDDLVSHSEDLSHWMSNIVSAYFSGLNYKNFSHKTKRL